MNTQASTAIVETITKPALNLAAIWQVEAGQADMAMLQLWYRLRDQWLRHHDSDATRRSYATATLQWLEWLADRDTRPWQATTEHVRAWLAWMLDAGNSGATANQRLSAVSSWYQFIIDEVHIVDGIERSAFFDAAGNTRGNPFKVGNLKRPKVTQYNKANPMHPATVKRVFDHLRSKSNTLTGSRNHALLLTHLLTASRGSEIVRLKWGDIRPNRNQPGSYVFEWSGKGDKEETTPLPADAYHAIVHHLKVAGRWIPGHPDHIQDDDYIFVPLVSHGLSNLRNVEGGAEEGHLSPKSVQRILQTSLRQAGIEDWASYRVHDLRHTFAHAHHSAFKDLEALRRLLHHESISTTGIYIRNMDDPVDSHSQAVMAQLGLL